MGFRDQIEFNLFFTIYGFSLIFENPVGYIFSGINADRLYVKTNGYFTKTSAFSDYLASFSLASENKFFLSDPQNFYLYLFGKVTDNYSEKDRFNHIRNWFINKVGIHNKYFCAADKKFYDEDADLLAQYEKDNYLTVWNPARGKGQKFNPPANKLSEPRAINISAHTKFLIDTFLTASRKPRRDFDGRHQQ